MRRQHQPVPVLLKWRVKCVKSLIIKPMHHHRLNRPRLARGVDVTWYQWSHFDSQWLNLFAKTVDQYQRFVCKLLPYHAMSAVQSPGTNFRYNTFVSVILNFTFKFTFFHISKNIKKWTFNSRSYQEIAKYFKTNELDSNWIAFNYYHIIRYIKNIPYFTTYSFNSKCPIYFPYQLCVFALHFILVFQNFQCLQNDMA